MPWSESDYPNSMKNLEPRVRSKAIEIANALLEEGYEEGRAISIAISQARKWAENRRNDEKGDSSGRDQHVVPHPRGWAVRASGAERATYVFPTREEAVGRATELALEQNSSVVIHDKSGKIRQNERPR